MLVDQKYHLTYCTNIHPGESWAEVFRSLEDYALRVKAALSPDQPFGLGLRLSNKASHDLGTGAALARFREWLDNNGLYVFTMNGFPYGGFHHQRVKDDVHRPDWRTPERLEYTMRLFNQLAVLLPEGMDGGVSTSPISYKPWLPTIGEQQYALEQGARRMAEAVAHLCRLEERTGRHLHLDIEPEPDGLLENTTETIHFFRHYLLPIGSAYLRRELGLSQVSAEAMLLRHLQVCYDVCHFAVAYENHAQALQQLRWFGIGIGKFQISAALRAEWPVQPAERQAIVEELRPFNESTYLHQVIARRGDGTFRQYSDLAEALPHALDPKVEEWRVHFHVPIFLDRYGRLASTQADIQQVAGLLDTLPYSRQLEVETYTWEVLPEALRVNLTESIVRELRWMKDQLAVGS